MKNRLSAREQLIAYGVPLGEDFHTFDSQTKERIARAAVVYGYRKSKNAPGSFARMFYEYANRGE